MTIYHKIFHIFLQFVLVTAVALSADAQSAFRNHRYDSFKATPTQEGQIVFAGNSITHMHSWFEAFGSHQNVIGRGNSGGFASELLENLESYIDSRPSKFFLMIGTNDISSGKSAERTADEIMTIVRRVRMESPETEVYVQSILPRSSNPKPDYEICNSIVSKAVDGMLDPKVHYIDLTKICSHIADDSFWSHDGLHPRPVGYAAWTRNIQDIVGYESVYPDTLNSQNSCGLTRSEAARVEQFPYMPVHEGDVLFFGDEQVHGAEWHELLRSDKIKDRGLKWGWDGISLANAINVVKSALENQENNPAKIFFFYGIGDKNISDYQELIKETKKLIPDTDIYIVSLSPSHDPDIDNENLIFNESIKKMADENNIAYVDIYTPLKQDVSMNIISTDYISGRGYVVMANELAKYLEDVSPVSLIEYENTYSNRRNRKIIGDALTSALIHIYGHDSGNIEKTKFEAITSAIHRAILAINDKDLTSSVATEVSSELESLLHDNTEPSK